MCDNVELVNQEDSLEDKLINELDADEVKNIIDLFNLNIKKKNVIRANKLSELQDSISNQMIERVEKNADAFSNKDLLEYFKTIQQTLQTSDTSSENVKVPVQITQTQINVNVEEPTLDRQSKQRVLDAIKAILAKQDQQILDVEYSTVEDSQYDYDWENYIGE